MRPSLLLLLPLAALATHAQTPAPADSLSEAFAQGKVSLNVRARYEGVDQTGLRDADAFTIGTRLGFITAPLHGIRAMIQAEDVTAIDGDRYNQAGLNPGGAGRAIVADPDGTEINQAWLSFAEAGTTLTVGRQMLILDNARFIGNVGWRQNMQTFDAATVKYAPSARLAATYSYLDRINRVFGDRHPQGDWQSDSHLFHVTGTPVPGLALTGYAYLLDFPTAAANSSATYGVSATGVRPLDETLKLSYRFEYAYQTDYADQPVGYSSDYYVVDAGLAWPQVGFAAGYEVLGSDNNVGFKTPLATLHAFNGWADLFLLTPAAGLQDTYVRASAKLPGAVELLAFHHWFSADAGGAEFGTEFDVQLMRKFGPRFTGLLKYASFDSESALPDVDKVWVQVEFSY